jgi:four helix bundle protein
VLRGHLPKSLFDFYNIALGSLSELETQAIISHRLNYLSDINSILENITEIRKMILGLIKYQKEKNVS